MFSDRLETAQAYGYTYPKCPTPYYETHPYRNALEEGGVYRTRNGRFKAACQPKEGSHDSGPFTCFFSGGFGTASFSRNALGFFDRWQLQPGLLTDCVLENAYFSLRWQAGHDVRVRKLRVSEDGFRPEEMTVTGLFPVVYEHFKAPDMPFEVVLERYSPIIPHNLEDSALPVTLFDFHILPLAETPDDIRISICLCWPNLLGWKQAWRTTEQPGGILWPSLQNAGNYAVLEAQDADTIHIRQGREHVGPDDGLCGNVILSLQAPGWTPSWDVMFKETMATTGYEPAKQLHTIGAVENCFAAQGRLADSDVTWETHWHEATASALAAETSLLGSEKSLTFALTLDLPITQFGMGRRWYKYYTENPVASSALSIARYALKKRPEWLQAIETFHRSELFPCENSPCGQEKASPRDEVPFSQPPEYRAARVNELYYLTSGGTILVSRPVDGWDSHTAALGQHPHFGLLEGFDTGYYYYNTLDLWVYGFYALSRFWPQLADWTFDDYLASAPLTCSRQNMIYRDQTTRDNLIPGKLPHDLGGCAEDLFVRLNGYNFRDTPNMWKDHNPSFVLAFYLHCRMTGRTVTRKEYDTLKLIMNFTEQQDTAGQAVPSHNEFGDSTWDNLHMQGLSAYCCSLCLGAWAVMAQLAADQKLEDDRCHYESLQNQAAVTMKKLWNGRYFTTDECGKYKNATMSDALFGLLLAHKAGLPTQIERELILSHLKAAWQNNAAAFCGGRYGALLVAEPDIQTYEKDGGDELQVNEVIVGSSWVLAACLQEFGLTEESDALASSMFQTIRSYKLQYRTPAAWTSDGHFRAPMNLRPLAVWLLDPGKTSSCD